MNSQEARQIAKKSSIDRFNLEGQCDLMYETIKFLANNGERSYRKPENLPDRVEKALIQKLMMDGYGVELFEGSIIEVSW